MPTLPRASTWSVAAALCLFLAAPAAGQAFGDYEHVGQLEDARHQSSGIGILGHSFEPSIVYKLFGVTTPHVAAATRLAWTDNYLQQDADLPGAPLRTATWETGVGARLDTQLSDHRLELSYQAIALEVIDSGRFDTVNQQAGARVDLYATDVEAHADATWARQSIAQSIQLNGIVHLDSYNVSAYGETRIHRWGLRIGGHVGGQVFDDLTDLSGKNFGLDVQVYGRIQPKLRGLVEYSWGIVTYDEGDDGTLNNFQTHSVLAGVDGTFTPKFSASLKMGVTLQDVDQGPGVDDRDFTGFVAALSASYEPFVTTTLTASYSRSISPSINSNYLLNDSVDLTVGQLVWEDAITVSASVGWTRSEVLDDETINRIRAGASATYLIRQWLSVLADYRFEKVNSSFPGASYGVHTVGISVGVGL